MSGLHLHTCLVCSVSLESEEQGQIEDGEEDDEDAAHHALEGVRPVSLAQEAARVRLPQMVHRASVRHLGPEVLSDWQERTMRA